MKRRNFCYWMSLGVLAGNLPVILAACNSNSNLPTPNASNSPNHISSSPQLDTTPREDGFQALGTIEQLKAEGTILDKKSAAKPVLIFTHLTTKEIAAINPTCTHQGCTVELKKETFICPCHGAKFDLDGAVVNPPANQALETFEVKQEGNLLLVKVPA